MKKKKICFLVLLLFIILNLISETNIYAKSLDKISGVFDKIDFSTYSDDELFDLLSNWNKFPKLDDSTGFRQMKNMINDTLSAPFIFYIPDNYDEQLKTPLLLYLHGGVGRQDFIEDFRDYAVENPFLPFAEQNNWFILFPAGNQYTMWWESVGIENIKTQIRYLKNQYNIDDDRIFVTGFSDGGSGSFHLALSDPTYFASFYPLNGFISVGSRVTKKPAYLPNLKNRFTAAINTDEDSLYPAAEMRQLMELAQLADADLSYKEYWGIGHSFDYADKEIPLIIENMKLHPRNIFKNDIYWETDGSEYYTCDWLEILELDTLETQQKWQQKLNLKMENKRIQFGFYDDRKFKGKGIKVRDIVEGSTSDSMHLLKDDIIIKMDGTPVDSISVLLDLRASKKRGDKVSLTVLRNNDEIKLNGQFPEIEFYDAFILNRPSGAVKAKYFGNQFEIETSRIKEIAILIHPDMVNLENPVIININGKERFNQKVSINRKFMIDNFRKNRDRKAIWIKKLSFQI